MDELPDVPALRVLEPPPGGLDALRVRLAGPRRRWWLVAGPALAAAIAMLVILVMRTPRTVEPTMAAPTPTAINDRTIGNDFYWVTSTPGRQSAPRAASPVYISLDQAPAVRDYQLP